MPNIYKASSVNMADSAMTVDIGDPYGAAPPVEGENRKAQETAEDLLKKAREKAEAIIRGARAEARSLAANAEKETERLRAEALENARVRGYNEGFAKGASDGEEMRREAEKTLKEARAERESAIKDLEPQAVKLIIEILNKLVGAYARMNPQVILKLIREGLSAAVGSDNVKLRVSPEDYDFVREHFGEVTEYAGSNSVELSKDASLKPMDCVIETAFGNIDSSLDQQFESLKADLTYTLNGAEA